MKAPLALVLALGGWNAVALPAEIVAIRAGSLVDPASGTVTADQVLLVEEGKIKAKGAALAVPPDARVIDLSRAFVSPGLMDGETHLAVSVINRPDIPRPSATGSTGAAFFTTVLQTTAYRAIQGVVHAREVLEAGFTTVRDCGHAANYADTALREAIEEGLVPGPTLINAGRIIAPFGGQFQLQPEKPGLLQPEYIFADTPDEIRKAVRQNVHYGARVIKIVVDDQPYIYSAADIRVIVDEAARAGLKVVAHCKGEAAARNAAEARVGSILHGHGLSDETLALLKRNGVVLVGTDFPLLVLKTMGFSNPEAYYARSVDRLRRAYRIGTPLVFGTDVSWPVAGYKRGELALTFIEPWVEAGVPAPAILRAMTSDAAELLGVGGKRGALEPGLAADLIATLENPLQNIETLKRVSFVMRDGRVVRWDR